MFQKSSEKGYIHLLGLCAIIPDDIEGGKKPT